MNVDDALSRTLAVHREALLAKANVVATGIGMKVTGGQRTDQLAIVCSVTAKVPLSALPVAEAVPPEIGGFVTDVIATGPIRALGLPTDRWRPAPGGVSIGHFRITAGTLGCLVRRGEETLVLSNNHVLADSNAGAPGDAILQPAPFDGGTKDADTIAVLDRYVPIVMLEQESSCRTARGAAAALNWLARLFGSDARLRAVSTEEALNLVDAATARPLDASLVTREVAGVGALTGSARAELGQAVRKSGRTTGLTSGDIVQVQVTVDVAYDDRTARFTDQVMAGAMSQGGDSGSAVLDGNGRIVGLLFAGSEQTTIINRIEHVFAALDIGL